MKNNASNQLLRVQTLIEQDRLGVSDSFMDLLVSDLNKLLLDYFDFSGVLDISIQKILNEYRVNIVLHPSRINSFYSLSNECSKNSV